VLNWYKAREDEEASAAVEFAILLPILLTVVFAIIDFGRVYAVKNNLVAAMREGARVAAVGSTKATDPSDGKAALRVAEYINGTVGGNVTAASVSVVKDATTGLIQVKLTTPYEFVPITPFVGKFFASKVPLPTSATFRWELAN
jgi:Flp pilus assembly protein TadG